MRVDLDPNFALDWDGNCIRLIPIKVIEAGHFTKPENVGKRRDGDPWFYSNIVHALQSYVSKAALLGAGATDAAGLLLRLAEIDKTIHLAAAAWRHIETLTPKAEE